MKERKERQGIAKVPFTYFCLMSRPELQSISHVDFKNPPLGLMPFIIAFIALVSLPAWAQSQTSKSIIDIESSHFDDQYSDRPPFTLINDSNRALSPKLVRNRQWLVAGVNAVGYGGTLILLNRTWYKGYAKTRFHVFNDAKEWLQVDKIGHAWGAYNAGKATADMWKWAGLPDKKANWIGVLSSTAFLTGIEFMDAYSAKWGWSWSDMVANIAGGGLYLGQEYLWNEQRLQFKFSFHNNNYHDAVLEQRANELFGKPWYERMLKDYNAQTYWLSANIHSFFPKSKWPGWLNMAIGYGGDGMFGGFQNVWIDKLGNEINRNDIPRRRQFYLAPDVDFTRIKTNKKWLRTTFSILNAFKCPAPALMLDSKGKFRAYAIYF